MISVCMATYNGEKFVGQQIKSILVQLGDDDELIISDDSSTDSTVEIIKSFNDSRIKLYIGQYHNPTLNFENAFSKASGEYIFLSDQDDIWLDNKIEVVMKYLNNYDLVAHNCLFIDEDSHIIDDRLLFNIKDSQKGFIRNLIHNHYCGCCMAFNRKVLCQSRPYPQGIMHDIWVGLVAELWFSPIIINEPLILHRLHLNNVSQTGRKSNLSYILRLRYRFRILKELIKLKCRDIKK